MTMKAGWLDVHQDRAALLAHNRAALLAHIDALTRSPARMPGTVDVCNQCDGSGCDSHPDSGRMCSKCNGTGGLNSPAGEARTPGYIECCSVCGMPRFYENGDKGSDGGCDGWGDPVEHLNIACPLRPTPARET